MNGLDLLTADLFDYAGMFPPAGLSFEAALEQSVGFHKTLSRPGLVGSELVISPASLDCLQAQSLAALGFPSKSDFRICLLGAELGSPGKTREAELAGLDRLNSRPNRGHGSPRVVSYEVKAPAGMACAEIERALRPLRERLRGEPLRLYVEPAWTPAQWAGRLPPLAQALERLNRDGKPVAGLKARGSGPAAVTPEVLSLVIAEVNARCLPLKATAGLHHPLVEKERYGNCLGFIGLAAALRLERALGPEEFGRESVLECLRSSTAEEFSFAGGLAWRGFRVEDARLKAALREVPLSIGSCSLEEPDQDLERLFPIHAGGAHD